MVILLRLVFLFTSAFATSTVIPTATSASSPPVILTPPEMVLIPAGKFQMGCGEDCPMPDTKPIHQVELDSFWMDKTPVTNSEYFKFVQSTKYKTVSERIPKQADFPGVPKENLKAGSAVFKPTNVSLENPYTWWHFIEGASWRFPNGPKSFDAVKSYANYPVVHVAYEDALTYCRWANKDLPTEAQFEYAARGGLSQKKYAWGNELKQSGKWVANIWQGDFPKKDNGEDGYAGLSPVDAFPKNGYGLHDMAGNVWQWCKDWYRPDAYRQRSKGVDTIRNPQGPTSSIDPNEPGVQKRVERGGSFLCSAKYCTRYLVGARGKGTPDSSSSNLGFRCVRNKN